MKTSTIEVGELVSTLSAAGVGWQLSTLPGVHHADVNYVAGSATVHYDESRITLDAIRQRVIDCGYHCRGELLPAHVCNPADHTTTGDVHADHAGHGDHSQHGGHGDSLTDQKADMMHDMGNAPGMSRQDMARDMRNR
ncbi:MAG: heavy metal-associated domain-containing protein, partial [Rhodoferax sp.]